jgi:CBS domain-containing protein
MTIAAILKRKGRDIVSIQPTVTLSEVARVLTTHRIGAVVVRDDAGRLAGIFSERDLVHAVAARGGEVLGDRVAQWMTRDLSTATRATTLITAMEMMTAGRFRHLPVLEEGELVGLVSIGDVVKARVEAQEVEVDGLRAYVAGGG